MKKLFSRNLFVFLAAPLAVFLFFLPNLLKGTIPIPGDALLGLYHPWRDVSYHGFNKGKFPVKNPLITDPILQTYPWRKIVIDNFKQLQLPFWNPYSFSGQPLLANVQSAPFQIFNFLFLLFPFKLAWGFQIILPLVLGAFFMSLFLKSLNLSNEAVIFGSILLPFSGFFVAWSEGGTVISSAIWLPLILFTINKLYRSVRPLWFLVLVLSASQSIFSGHIQTSIYVFMTSILFAVFLFLRSRKFTPMAICLTGLILGIAISAIQIIPTLEFVKLSARGMDQLYVEGRQDWFLPLQNLVQLFVPDFFGNPTTYNYWGVWNYGEFVSFIGVVATSFAILGVFAKTKQIAFFIFLFFLSLALALPNSISKIPYFFNIPFLSSMQPSRIIFLAIFSLCVLCAFGFEFFLKSKAKIKLFLLPLSIFVFIFLLVITSFFLSSAFPLFEGMSASRIAFRNLIIPGIVALFLMILFSLKLLKFPKTLVILAIFALTIFEIFRFANKFLPFSKQQLIFPETKLTTFLENQQKPFRLLSTDRRIFDGNTASVYKIETVQGYDPLFLKDYARLVSSWNENKKVTAGNFNRIITPQNYDSPIADLLNVKYVASFDDISQEGFRKIYQEGETKIFVNENAFGRAFLVNEIIKVENKDAELQKMFEESTNFKTTAYSSEISFAKQGGGGKISFETYSDRGMSLNVLADQESPLVISNIYYPGWKAFINGKNVPIYRVNYLLQAVIVPAGESLVEFKFLPRSFYNGFYISVGSLAFTISITFLIWRKRFQ